MNQLKLIVRDQNGTLTPFRADWHLTASGNAPFHERVHQVWNDTGTAEIDVPAGRISFRIQRGFLYDAVELDVQVPSGGALTREIVLNRRLDAKSLGWYGGESHLHVLHGKNDPPRTIADGGRMAAADGLDFLQLGYAWDASFAWLPAEELNRQCREASSAWSRIGWNIETPKCYFSEDDGGKSGRNLHCFGHGWTVGLKDNSRGERFFSTGPNFRIMQEVQRQGGIVGCAHPVRSWFTHKGTFVSNWASELPFDFVAGVPFAAVDILNDSPLLFFQSERLWYTLLNLGYKVAGTGNSDGALGDVPWGLGRFRTYVKIDGGFSWEKLAQGIQVGRCIASSGPFVLFTVDEQPPGAEFPADGKPRRASVRAWSAPNPGEKLVAVQLVRNGEVVRAWDLRAENARYWETAFELREGQFAWYCVRVLSTCGNPLSQELWGPQVNELAVANPVYFLPRSTGVPPVDRSTGVPPVDMGKMPMLQGFQRPSPAAARVCLNITDADTGQPLNATVEIHDGAGVLKSEKCPASGGVLTMPATASLRISASGYETQERNLFMDCPELYEYSMNIGTVWPSFYSPETFHELRKRLGNLKVSVVLKKI